MTIVHVVTCPSGHSLDTQDQPCSLCAPPPPKKTRKQLAKERRDAEILAAQEAQEELFTRVQGPRKWLVEGYMVHTFQLEVTAKNQTEAERIVQDTRSQVILDNPKTKRAATKLTRGPRDLTPSIFDKE